MELRNPVLLPDGRIDCEINHPTYGWIPFTADMNDIHEHSKEIYQAALAMNPVEYVEPPVDMTAIREGMSLTFIQLLIGLVSEGWISEAEGEAWLEGTLPQAVLDVIVTLPTEQRFIAKARALRPTIVERTDALVSALALAEGKTEEELDLFFETYALV